MAASLMRVVRRRPFKLVSLGVLRSPFVASFCTQNENPGKPAYDRANKTAEASDERATLLAYKTAVAFPARLSEADSLGVAEQVTPETAVVAATTEATSGDAVHALIATSKSGDIAANGLSSSSSSESDSDSDDEKPDFDGETKNLSIDLSRSAVQKKTKVNQNYYKQYSPFCASEAVPGKTLDADQVHVAPEICAVIEYSPEVPSFKASVSAASNAQMQTPAKVSIKAATCENAPTNVPFATTKATFDEKLAKAVVSVETASELFAPVESEKKQVNHGPFTAEAARHKLQIEAAVKPSEEAAAASYSDAEKPYDNSIYKNYQHHSYTVYTFVDLDVEMAKFRLPQPSSGRP